VLVDVKRNGRLDTSQGLASMMKNKSAGLPRQVISRREEKCCISNLLELASTGFVVFWPRTILIQSSAGSDVSAHAHTEYEYRSLTRESVAARHREHLQRVAMMVEAI
jgi:hypothetical protein